MITATLHEAKAKLNKLVEAARLGEQVVLLRGSEIVATIIPLDPADIEIASVLSDQAAEKFWKEIDIAEKKTFPNPAKAVAYLKKRAAA